MKRLKALLQQPEFSIVLFLFGCVLFVRPLLVMSEMGRSWVSVFLSWTLIIALLFIVSQSLATTPSVDESLNEENEEVNDA